MRMDRLDRQGPAGSTSPRARPRSRTWTARRAEQYIGGLGLGARYLYDEVDPHGRPPRRRTTSCSSPPARSPGTGAPAGNRYMLVTKSPLTGGIANSNAAGEFAQAIKFAGFDMVIVEGASKKPVYVYIDDGRVSFRDAAGAVGPGHRADRARGDRRHRPRRQGELHRPGGREAGALRLRDERHGPRRRPFRRRRGDGLQEAQGHRRARHRRREGRRQGALPARPLARCYEALTDPYIEHFHKHGTPGVLELVNSYGGLPTKNFRFGTNDHHEDISGERLAEVQSVRKRMGMGCPACPVACGRVSKARGGDYAGGRRPRVRDHRHVRLELLHQRPRGGDAGQLHLQPRGHGHHHHGRHHRLRHGDVRARAHPQGRHRLRPAVRRRRGHGEAHAR